MWNSVEEWGLRIGRESGIQWFAWLIWEWRGKEAEEFQKLQSEIVWADIELEKV